VNHFSPFINTRRQDNDHSLMKFLATILIGTEIHQGTYYWDKQALTIIRNFQI